MNSSPLLVSGEKVRVMVNVRSAGGRSEVGG